MYDSPSSGLVLQKANFAKLNRFRRNKQAEGRWIVIVPQHELRNSNHLASANLQSGQGISSIDAATRGDDLARGALGVGAQAPLRPSPVAVFHHAALEEVEHACGLGRGCWAQKVTVTVCGRAETTGRLSFRIVDDLTAAEFPNDGAGVAKNRVHSMVEAQDPLADPNSIGDGNYISCLHTASPAFKGRANAQSGGLVKWLGPGRFWHVGAYLQSCSNCSDSFGIPGSLGFSSD
mmetsp:Transcript_85622/g.228309  ORF Transcript_85622/g.228309 Transcript_85622/m.228309 type:complete len:234 (+) Transcript_85622:2104-2805(+)